MTFSATEALSFGWQTFKGNWKFLISLLIIIGAIVIVPETVAGALQETNPLLSLAFSFGSTILQIILLMGAIRITLEFIDQKKPSYEHLFSSYPLIIKFVMGTILYQLIVVLGFLLLIIPGIYWAIKYQYVGYLIVDKGIGPRGALSKSGALTEGIKIKLILFGLLLGLIVILGALALGVGLFVAIPVVMLATTYVYRQLLSQADLPSEEPPTPPPALDSRATPPSPPTSPGIV